MDTQQFMERVRIEGESVARRPIIDMRGIKKSYYVGKPNELEILHGIDLTVYPGEFVAIVGESGSGKSTLMNMIGALDRPTPAPTTSTAWTWKRQRTRSSPPSATARSASCSRPST
jgi:ABC-type glutathione transport system ATPase component